MRKLQLAFLASVGIVLATSMHALPADGGPPDSLAIRAQHPLSADAEFLQQAGQAGEAEFAMAALAQRQGHDARVKTLADILKRDHEAARTELQKLAKLKNAELTAMTVAQLAVHSRLEKLTQSDFDRAWLQEMVDLHRQTRGLYSRASRSADADVKSFATRQLSTLTDHLKRAQQIQRDVK